MKRILIIQTASIGDVILATPVIEGLRHAYSSAVIDILIKKGMEGLFAGHPFLNRVIIWDKTNKYRDFLRILNEVRKQKYDLVVNIQRFFSTGMLTAFSGASASVGFSKNPLSFLFTKSIPHKIGKGIHEVERNMSLINELIAAADFSKEQGNRPRLYPSGADKARVLQFKASPYITISPASLWFTKQYPVNKWVELIQSLPAEFKIYLLGSKSDAGLCEEIKSLSKNESLSILAGSLNLLESAALMQDASMNYTNDSAPMHLASSVNAPTAVVYCSTVPEFGFGPLSEKHWIIQTTKDLKCRPCGLHGQRSCPLQHFECAATIRPDLFPRLPFPFQKF
ncbi:MAG: glycosyltransferase family 9 protein [Bacteroidota bacterium]